MMSIDVKRCESCDTPIDSVNRKVLVNGPVPAVWRCGECDDGTLCMCDGCRTLVHEDDITVTDGNDQTLCTLCDKES